MIALYSFYFNLGLYPVVLIPFSLGYCIYVKIGVVQIQRVVLKSMVLCQR